MWKNKSGSNQRGSSKKSSRDTKDKDKRFIISYKCNKPGHFKFECLDLDKKDDKKNYFQWKDKKVLMSTSEDLDDTLSNKEIEEEANFCFMADTT